MLSRNQAAASHYAQVLFDYGVAVRKIHVNQQQLGGFG